MSLIDAFKCIKTDNTKNDAVVDFKRQKKTVHELNGIYVYDSAICPLMTMSLLSV